MAGAGDMYAKGSPLGWDKEWYHGELSRVEAEQALATDGCDRFLIRSCQGALILSLIHHGQLHHININYGRGWYELQTGQALYTLTELEELVSHYSNNEIGGLQIKLGVACTKANIKGKLKESHKANDYQVHHTVHGSDSQCIYAKGEPEDLIKFSWYHGKITKEQADAALRESELNTFLVRVSDKRLVLSKTLGGWRSHDVIHYSPKGYRLDGKDEQFGSVSELITHYQHHPIQEPWLLGKAITKVHSVAIVQEMEEELAYEAILFRKEETALSIQWRRICDLPVGRTKPEVVKIGNSLYVGGGMGRDGRENVDYKFDMTQEAWTALPSCPTWHHALTTLNSELIAIGGIAGSNAVSTAYTLQSGKWIEVLPPMPTPRYYLAAASHDNRFIIAAGGTTKEKRNGEGERTQAVDVYAEEHRVWYSTNPLPFPVCGISMCIINTTCYILGCTEQVNITFASSLLENARTSQLHVPAWKQLSNENPLYFSSSVELNGRLFTMGGSSHPVYRQGTRFISTYDFTSSSWVECKSAQLPIPLYRAGVVKLNSDQVMIVGGQSKSQQYSAAAFIGYISEEKLETLV